jgi:hypothetical protein
VNGVHGTTAAGPCPRIGGESEAQVNASETISVSAINPSFKARHKRDLPRAGCDIPSIEMATRSNLPFGRGDGADVTSEADRTTSEHFPAGSEDLLILPIVAIALAVKIVLRSAWIVLRQLIDVLFPVLLQLMRFPLFTLRILGDGAAALLKGIARFLPIGGVRRAAWQEFVSRHWAWIRQKISYKAFEEAVHHLFESGMAWVFRTCKALTPNAALLVLFLAVLWLPVSFGVATVVHTLLIAKATSLPAWMQLFHVVATVIAKSKLLVLPVYPAAWPQAKQHPSMQATIRSWHAFTTLYLVRKTRYRYRKLDSAVAHTVTASIAVASSLGLSRLFDVSLAAVNAAAAATARGLRTIAAKAIAVLSSAPLLGPIVRNYADHYDAANRRPAALLSDQVAGALSRWSIKFSAEYYETKEREEAAKSPAQA